MSEKKPTYWERVKANRERVKEDYRQLQNSVELKKFDYVRRCFIVFFGIFIFVFLGLAYLGDKFLGIPEGIAPYTALGLAIVLAVVMAVKKTKNRFPDEGES